MVSVSGWSGPSFDVISLRVSSCSAIASVRSPSSTVGGSEVIAVDERVGVVGADLQRPQLERLLEEQDRLGRPTGGQIGQSKVALADERVGVVGAQRTAQSVGSLPEQIHRLARIAKMVPIVPKLSQGVQGLGGVAGLEAALDLQLGADLPLGLGERPQAVVGAPRSCRGGRPRPPG